MRTSSGGGGQQGHAHNVAPGAPLIVFFRAQYACTGVLEWAQPPGWEQANPSPAPRLHEAACMLRPFFSCKALFNAPPVARIWGGYGCGARQKLCVYCNVFFVDGALTPVHTAWCCVPPHRVMHSVACPTTRCARTSCFNVQRVAPRSASDAANRCV